MQMQNVGMVMVRGFFLAIGIILLIYFLMRDAHAIDPLSTVGPEQCIDCHSGVHSIWEESTHYKTYEELASSDRGLEIAEAMDVDDIEGTDGECVGCHFTIVGESEDELEPIAGISCESCHGAALDWYETHGEYPGEGPDSESSARREARIAAADEAGMIRPERIDAIAANCLGCHTVPNEKLVNVGGHTAGSDFELVSWSQGEVRHNVFWNDSGENAEASPERKRVLYVVGLATDLQFSLLALGKATEEGDFLAAMKQRVTNALAQLEQANSAKELPELNSIISLGKSAHLDLDSQDALQAAANSLGTQISKFATSYDGSGLAAIDSLIQAEYRYSDKY